MFNLLGVAPQPGLQTQAGKKGSAVDPLFALTGELPSEVDFKDLALDLQQVPFVHPNLAIAQGDVQSTAQLTDQSVDQFMGQAPNLKNTQLAGLGSRTDQELALRNLALSTVDIGKRPSAQIPLNGMSLVENPMDVGLVNKLGALEGGAPLLEQRPVSQVQSDLLNTEFPMAVGAKQSFPGDISREIPRTIQLNPENNAQITSQMSAQFASQVGQQKLPVQMVQPTLPEVSPKLVIDNFSVAQYPQIAIDESSLEAPAMPANSLLAIPLDAPTQFKNDPQSQSQDQSQKQMFETGIAKEPTPSAPPEEFFFDQRSNSANPVLGHSVVTEAFQQNSDLALAMSPEALAQPLDAQDGEQLIARAQYLASQGGGSMKMVLNPDGLGQVELDVKVMNGEVLLNLRTETAEAKQLIEKSLEGLSDSLTLKSLTLGEVKVEKSLESSLSDFMQRQNEDARSQAQEFARGFLDNFRQGSQGFRDHMATPMSALYGRDRSEAESVALNPLLGGVSGKDKQYKELGKGRALNLVA